MSRDAQWTQRKSCQVCMADYWAARSDSRTCGPKCKKALQRAAKSHPRDVAVIHAVTAAPLVRDSPRSIIEALLKTWPHGTEVLYNPELGPAQPGRINWLCRAGEQLKSRFKWCYSHLDTACVPVESLCEVQIRFVGCLERVTR